MAIEKVKRAWFLVESGSLNALINGLADSRTVHVVDLQEEPEDAPTPETETAARRTHSIVAAADFTPDLDLADDNVNKLTRSLDVLDGFIPPKRPFYLNFVNLPAEMTQAEFDEHVAAIDVGELYEQTAHIQRDHAAAQKRAAELSARINQLSDWADAAAPPAGLTRHGADLGTLPAKALPQLEEADAGSETLAAGSVAVKGNRALVSAVWLNAAEEEADELLDSVGFASLEIAPGSGKVAAVIQKCETALVTVEAKLAVLEKDAAELAADRRAVVASLAHWQTEVERHTTSTQTLASGRIATLSGYILVRELPKLDALLATDFPSVSVVTEDPAPDEDVPVSLGGHKFFAPAQFLTSMFGLPNYFEFDPSPYIMVMFLLFFGFCFGDVIYGVGLFALGWWLARKAAAYPSLVRFCTLFSWCGLSAAVFGLLTGSWASDLLSTKYLGSGDVARFIISMREGPALVDLMDKPLIGLGLALGIGLFTQFYGIFLLMYREIRKGNMTDALLDGGLWLLFFPALLLMLASTVLGWPTLVTHCAVGLAGVSALALVLTQGRNEESFLAKAISGVVSLYGILGSYGMSAFLSDVLSYSRLLALGLATVVIGMAFNYIGGIMSEIPFVGLVLFIIAVAIGHTFNFFLSILGGFVHSVRLIFVELFSRFYEGGARPFAPLGEPQTVRIIDENL